MAHDTPAVLLIHYPEDGFSSLVSAKLERRGIRTISIVPGALGSSRLSLQGKAFRVDGVPIAGILFRVAPDAKFSEDFVAGDQSFSDAEVRAVLLAALHLDSILAINRYDPMAWFEGLGWPTWRRRMIAAGVAVSDFKFGSIELHNSPVWHPYAGLQTMPAPGQATARMLGAALTTDVPVHHSLIFGGDSLTGCRSASISAAARMLAKSGIYLAEIVTDQAGNILMVDTLPTISDPAVQIAASDGIVEIYHAHLHRR